MIYPILFQSQQLFPHYTTLLRLLRFQETHDTSKPAHHLPSRHPYPLSSLQSFLLYHPSLHSGSRRTVRDQRADIRILVPTTYTRELKGKAYIHTLAFIIAFEKEGKVSYPILTTALSSSLLYSQDSQHAEKFVNPLTAQSDFHSPILLQWLGHSM